MAKYRKRPIVVDAEPYIEGLEDYFKYYIPMFGLFTEQECIEAGFTPDFENDKIPFISTIEGERPVLEGKHMIVTGIKGERYPVEIEIFHETYNLVDEKYEEMLQNIPENSSIYGTEKLEYLLKYLKYRHKK